MAGTLPRRKKMFEYIVNELALTTRIHDFFVGRVFLEVEEMPREEAERTADIGLECADRPRPRSRDRQRSVELHVGSIGPHAANTRPGSRGLVDGVPRNRIRQRLVAEYSRGRIG